MNTFIDITVALSSDLPFWPGSPGVAHTWLQRINSEQAANVSHLSLELHSGTHIDAPLHFVEGGKSVDQLNPELFMGKAQVIYLPQKSELYAQDLKEASIHSDTTRLLIKTDNSTLWEPQPSDFYADFCALKKDAAEYLVEIGIQLVGIDYLSIQKYQDPPDVHQILLKNEVIILESINLSQVSSGDYQMHCLPLLIPGAEASPVRVILSQ